MFDLNDEALMTNDEKKLIAECFFSRLGGYFHLLLLAILLLCDLWLTFFE